MHKSTDIRTLKKLEKPTRYTIPDTRGLHLWIRSIDTKYWIFRYTFDGVRFDMSLGRFPLVTLADARQKVLQLKRQLLNNINPIEDRKLHKKLASEQKNNSIKFQDFAIEFIEKMSPQWTNSNHEKAWNRSMEIYVNPIIGRHPLRAIKTEQVTEILQPIWDTKNVTASRLRGRLEKIFSAAITMGFHPGPNPAIWTGHLQNLLPHIRNKPKHYKALDYKSIPDLMKKIMTSQSITSLALQFTILTASRTGETVHSKRDELFGDVWIIPKERMKARAEHQVPLSNRALEIISQATASDPDSHFIFSKNGKPLAHTSMLHFLNAQGIDATVHGFRSSFRDWVSEETSHSSEVAEMALAHTVTNKVEAAYRRGNLLQRRKLLMIDWENYCLDKSKTQED